MRWQALSLLFALAIGFVTPPPLYLADANGGHVTIGTLDVCHSHTPALSPHSNAHFVIEHTTALAPPMLETVADIPITDVFPFSPSFPLDQPPKT